MNPPARASVEILHFPYFEDADRGVRSGEFALRVDEIEALKESERCEACGHLYALHNFHCCSFCMVPDCECAS